MGSPERDFGECGWGCQKERGRTADIEGRLNPNIKLRPKEKAQTAKVNLGNSNFTFGFCVFFFWPFAFCLDLEIKLSKIK